MTQKIIPNLWFDSDAEEAAKFYITLFEDSMIKQISRYGKSGSDVAGKSEGSVMTVHFSLSGHELIALNGGPVFKFSPAISLYVACETPEEVGRLFAALSEKGTVLMPLDRYPFSERYAWINDRYGLSWQLFCGGAKQKITPCLLFVKEHYGKTREAMDYYQSVFGSTDRLNVTPYDKGEGEIDGALKHAEFSLAGEWFIAMDSGFAHEFSFTPAISFMVNCRDQTEIDRLWKLLSAVPEAEQCGWLQDRFGISWQIIPADWASMTEGKSPEKIERMMKTMFQMKKFDIETLRKTLE